MLKKSNSPGHQSSPTVGIPVYLHFCTGFRPSHDFGPPASSSLPEQHFSEVFFARPQISTTRPEWKGRNSHLAGRLGSKATRKARLGSATTRCSLETTQHWAAGRWECVRTG